MAEFMEQSFHFVDGQQGRSVAYGLGEAAYVAYQWTYAALLFAVIAHPGTTAFAGTGKVIYIEDSYL